ncbi:MAG: transposase [Mangrovibacterium sp.]
MSNRNHNFRNRKSIRLKGYDYSKAGLYFITLCAQNRECLFGNIDDNEMILNDAGRMVEKWYVELENKYPNIRCHEMVVMPNHFHCIVEITDTRVIPDAHAGAPLRGRPENQYGPDNKKYNPTIGHIMDWFKTMTTNEYIRGVKTEGWKRFDQKLWQRNYWEHIIRKDGSYERIAEYIGQNPSKWKDDRLNGH